jgi:hypothetical protein
LIIGTRAPAIKYRQTVHEVRKAFADLPAAELEKMIEEAVDSIRKQKHRKRRGRGEK